MPLIEVNNLTKVYTDGEIETPVLHGVSFTIERGEFVAIMGPSGSGKSTLLHIIGFLDEYTSGSYRFSGTEAREYAGDKIAQIRNQKLGFIFQSFNLLSNTNVLENVKLPLLYSQFPEPEWDERAMNAIRSVGLEHRSLFNSTQLSGGERQRVAIARALVCEPEVIFADEPTGNLDSKSGGVVIDLLQKLNEEMGHTIILITHEMETAEHAQRIIRIKDGLIESDSKITRQRRAQGGVLNK
ncbi:MAG: ABC transporter ATP-binding protein [Candidatus Yonathbacteria bacterium]|nr:ABC transporter ATP-binding protein [Candidatus Yonathbacteria bacterium]